MVATWLDDLSFGLDKMKVVVSESLLQQFNIYMELLLKWNKTINLTAITDKKTIVKKHFLDSVSVIPFLKKGALLDVGSGAGFPGVVVGLICDQKKIVCLDASLKKISFLKQLCYELGLKNVKCVHQRLEQYNPSEPFDMMITRAFNQFPMMIKWSKEGLSSNGYCILMKGVYPEELLTELKQKPLKIGVYTVEVPLLQAKRHIVIIQPKEDQTWQTL